MIKPKPIILIKMPHEAERKDYTRQAEELNDRFQNEYYVLVMSAGVDFPDVEIFYDKYFTEVEYEELKAMIKQSLTKSEEKVLEWIEKNQKAHDSFQPIPHDISPLDDLIKSG